MLVCVLLVRALGPGPAPLPPPPPPQAHPPRPISPALTAARPRPPALLPAARGDEDLSLDGPTETLVARVGRVNEPLEKQELLLELKARQSGGEVMLALLDDPDREVRMVAAESLEVLAEARVLPALPALAALQRLLAHERDPEVRHTLTAVTARLQAPPKSSPP